jgi:arginyl-tRNA synthetase
MNDYLHTFVSKALHELFGMSPDFVIEHPKDMSHGDYATNAALIVAKTLQARPKESAEKLMEYLNTNKEEFIQSITIAGPGFINFTLDRKYFVDAIHEAAHVEAYGHTNIYTGKKILVEHSSPNLFKPFHIGHLMNNTIGESITRLAKYSGAQVSTISFPSDVSLGVAKAIYILLEKHIDGSVSYTIDELGNAYVEGTKKYDEDESIHVRVKEIADNLYARKDSPEYGMYEITKAFNIAYFESIVAKLGSQFDAYIYESEAGVDGKKIVLEHTPSVFTESEGAIVYTPNESDKHLNTAVFINSQGNPTYEAKDIGLLDLKFKTYTPDLSIFITDAQQVSHFQVVLDAGAKINPDWKEKSLHRYHGRMSFKGAKMSSRLGGVPTVESILAAVVEEVKTKNPDIGDSAAQQIGIAAIKFAILRAAAGKNIDFDPDTSLSFEGDSGPYVQYTAVRAQSLLEKGRDIVARKDLTTKPVPGTETIERLVARFPEVVAEAQQDWTPHTIVGYLLELAQAFNSWYGQGKIIDEDIHATAYRLAVVKAVRQTLVNGLDVLGIEAPIKM